MSELPKLTTKQQQFVLHYTINGGNATEAYKKSYNCKDMKDTSITVEASKMLKNPNISLWLEQAKSNVQEVFEEEIKSLSRDADGDYCAQKYGKHECRNTNKPRSFGIRIRSFYKMEKRFSNFFSHSRFPPYYRCNYRRFPLRRASLS